MLLFLKIFSLVGAPSVRLELMIECDCSVLPITPKRKFLAPKISLLFSWFDIYNFFFLYHQTPIKAKYFVTT